MTGASELVLMAQVARRFYLKRQSKSRIADDLDISRFRVARLLNAAVAQQVVRFEVGLPGDVDLGLSAELREAYGLLHCVVIDPPSSEEESGLRRTVGRAAAELLTEIVGEHDVLGLASSRILMGMERPLARFAGCPVVQTTGALSRPDALDVMDTVRWFTRAGGGPAYVFYAPLICQDRVAAEAGWRQPDMVRSVERFGDLTVVVAGIGAWQPQLSEVHDAAPPADQRRCGELGVRVEIGGMLVDEHGAAVATPLSDRILAMRESELRAVPTRIAVAAGTRRSDAVRIVLASGLANSLVTHRTLAEAVLNG